MSAVQFKVGDRVRLVNPICGEKNERIGDEFTVQHIDSRCVYIHEDGMRRLPEGGWSVGVSDGWMPCRFEKIKPKRDYVADHARRTLRKAGLSKEEARQVVENWDSTAVPLSAFSRKVPAVFSNVGPAQFLWAGFMWDNTPQGHEYWYKVAERIEKEQNAQAQ